MISSQAEADARALELSGAWASGMDDAHVSALCVAREILNGSLAPLGNEAGLYMLPAYGDSGRVAEIYAPALGSYDARLWTVYEQIIGFYLGGQP
jgi:hypothetical protein